MQRYIFIGQFHQVIASAPESKGDYVPADVVGVSDLYGV